MTFDDLAKIFENACFAYNEAHPDCSPDDLERAGIRALVRALRDEFKRWIDADKMFMTILGSDAGNEKAAGGTIREDVPGAASPVRTPAADPKVCVWTKLRNSWGFKTSCSNKWLMNENYGGDTCPLCEGRIEYKEPTT